MVRKLLGKHVSGYSLGYGLFTYLDIPLAAENQSLRFELMDATNGDGLAAAVLDTS